MLIVFFLLQPPWVCAGPVVGPLLVWEATFEPLSSWSRGPGHGVGPQNHHLSTAVLMRPPSRPPQEAAGGPVLPIRDDAPLQPSVYGEPASACDACGSSAE